MNGQDNESWEFDPTSLVRIIMEEQGNQIGSRTSLQKGLGLSRLKLKLSNLDRCSYPNAPPIKNLPILTITPYIHKIAQQNLLSKVNAW